MEIKIKEFFLVGSVFRGRAGMLTNYLFLFGLSYNQSVINYFNRYDRASS